MATHSIPLPPDTLYTVFPLGASPTLQDPTTDFDAVVEDVRKIEAEGKRAVVIYRQRTQHCSFFGYRTGSGDEEQDKEFALSLRIDGMRVATAIIDALGSKPEPKVEKAPSKALVKAGPPPEEKEAPVPIEVIPTEAPKE